LVSGNEILVFPEGFDTKYALSDEVVCQVGLEINSSLLNQTVQSLEKCLERVVHSNFECLLQFSWLSVLCLFLNDQFHVRNNALVEPNLNLMLPRTKYSILNPLVGHLVVSEGLRDVQFGHTVEFHLVLDRLG
jgi:hypothetical protein